MSSETYSTESAAMQLLGVKHRVGARTILEQVDLTLRPGSSIAISGPSGSGKTTLLLCMAGLVTPDEGSVVIGSVEMGALKPAARADVRLKSIGVVYQFGELLPELSPLENVALPALLGGMDHRIAYRRAADLITSLDMAGSADTSTAVLSGGERQRIAVARALITEPLVVLADEPTGALDEDATGLVMELLYSLPQRYGCAVAVVTHNQHVADGADRHVQLCRGKLVEVAR